jgi:tetratricopeptide (TPR) repeat protein
LGILLYIHVPSSRKGLLFMTKKTIVTGTTGKASPKARTTAGAITENLPSSPAEIQRLTYAEAVGLFSQRKLSEALSVFLDAAKGPQRDIADKARSYAQVCERRTAGFDLQLYTADDHFNYGVERLNARDIGCAKDHLDRALKLNPDGDHIYYTMALCCALDGDGSAACENLKRAIELEPRNRILARQDPEFVALIARIPGFRAMLASD